MATFFLEGNQSLALLIKNFKEFLGYIHSFSIRFKLQVDSGNDIVDIQGKLPHVQFFGIVLINNGFK